MRYSIGLCVLMLLIAVRAYAADETGKWYINPQAGYLRADSNRNVDDDFYYGLGVGQHIGANWNVELNALFGSYNGASGNDLDIHAYSFDALRIFRRASAVSPFVGVGLGYLEDRPDPGIDRRNFLAQLDAGLLIDIAENASHTFVLQLRPELKGRWDFIRRNPDTYFDLMAGIGLQFSFGSPPPTSRRQIEEPPRPQSVVAPPAPPPPPPPAPPPPRDSDGDSVIDSLDQCPGTPRGTAVDAVGCPRKGSVTLHGVNFENNSATLLVDSRPILDGVAADLKEHPRLKVELQGHTDSVGADSYNLRLSQHRAEAVRDYLLSQGIGANQLTAKGYGESKPVADNRTAAGRAENRRVEMNVIDNPGDVDVKIQ